MMMAHFEIMMVEVLDVDFSMAINVLISAVVSTNTGSENDSVCLFSEV